MMDITTQKVADTAAIHVKSASGEHLYDEGKPVRIIVHGPGTAAFGAIEARQTQRALKRMQDNDDKVTVASPEDRRRETAEDLAAITVGFEHLDYNGLTGAELYRAVYSDPALGFIPRQVTKFLADWGNFSAASIAA